MVREDGMMTLEVEAVWQDCFPCREDTLPGVSSWASAEIKGFG